MDTVREKIAYLRGLITGADFYGKDETAKNVWTQLIEVVDDLAKEVATLRELQDEMGDYVDAIDDDLAELQEDIYGDTSDDDAWVDVECPHCGDQVTFEEDILYDDDTEIVCPQCGEVVYSGDNVVENAGDSDETNVD